MSEDRAPPSLRKEGNCIVISDGLREVARVEVMPPWHGVVLFIAGAVCAPLFLAGVWLACQLAVWVRL